MRVRNISICSLVCVLGFVEYDKRVVERTTTHVGQGRDFDDAAFNVLLDFVGSIMS